MRNKRSANRHKKAGSASVEVVLAVGVLVVIAASFYFLAERACAGLFHVAAQLVGWPYS